MRAATASALPPPAAGCSPSEIAALSMPDSTEAANLSFSSSTILSAIFLPTPFALVRAFASSKAIASCSCSSVNAERIDIPAFAPTPLTEISFLKASSSPRLEKPYRLTSSSRTLIIVYTLTSSPSLLRYAAELAGTKISYPIPPASMITYPAPFSARVPLTNPIISV